jgi:hypothetical protein
MSMGQEGGGLRRRRRRRRKVTLSDSAGPPLPRCGGHDRDKDA